MVVLQIKNKRLEDSDGSPGANLNLEDDTETDSDSDAESAQELVNIQNTVQILDADEAYARHITEMEDRVIAHQLAQEEIHGDYFSQKRLENMASRRQNAEQQLRKFRKGPKHYKTDLKLPLPPKEYAEQRDRLDAAYIQRRGGKPEEDAYDHAQRKREDERAFARAVERSKQASSAMARRKCARAHLRKLARAHLRKRAAAVRIDYIADGENSEVPGSRSELSSRIDEASEQLELADRHQAWDQSTSQAEPSVSPDIDSEVYRVHKKAAEVQEILRRRAQLSKKWRYTFDGQLVEI